MRALNDTQTYCDDCGNHRELWYDTNEELSLCEQCQAQRDIAVEQEVAECNDSANRAERRRQVHTSHDACDHPKTKTARQACRRARARTQTFTEQPKLTSDDLKQMAEESRANPAPAPTQREVTPAHRNAYEELTAKQRIAVATRMTAFGWTQHRGTVYMRASVLMVESARVGKCSIAKLSDNKVRQIIGVAQMLDR